MSMTSHAVERGTVFDGGCRRRYRRQAADGPNLRLCDGSGSPRRSSPRPSRDAGDAGPPAEGYRPHQSGDSFLGRTRSVRPDGRSVTAGLLACPPSVLRRPETENGHDLITRRDHAARFRCSAKAGSAPSLDQPRRPTPCATLGEGVEGDLQVADAVVLRCRQAPARDVHLQGLQDQPRHRKCGVPGLAEDDELLLRARLPEMGVVGLLACDRALPRRADGRPACSRAPRTAECCPAGRECAECSATRHRRRPRGSRTAPCRNQA